MQAGAAVVAEFFGISVEKLERLTKRKDCVKGIVNEDGEYDTAKVEQMLAKLKKQAAMVRAQFAAKKARDGGETTKTVKRDKTRRAEVKDTPAAANEPVAETLEEFIKRFWEEEERWWEFITCDTNEDWMKHFIQKALEFGYTAAYPGAEQEG